MSAINIEAWELVRAVYFESQTTAVNFDGVTGAETLAGAAVGLVDRATYDANPEIGKAIRRAAYSLLGVLDMHGPWYTVDPLATIPGSHKGIDVLPNPTPFENGWRNFYDLAGFPAQARITAQGDLQLRGQVHNDDGAATGLVWRLPATHRPQRDFWFNCAASGGFARMYVTASGEVRVYAYTAATANWVDLTGVQCSLS